MRAVLATVVGPSGRRDLSLPADTPAAELLPTLVRLLSGSRPRPPVTAGVPITAPPAPPPTAAWPPPTAGPGATPGSWPDSPVAWALITATGQPIPPWASLAEHGVLHGEHLYLVADPPLPPQLRHLQP